MQYTSYREWRTIESLYPLSTPRAWLRRARQPARVPNTLLIDSEQLESGDALDPKFREMAGPEIEQFRREIVERSGNREDAGTLSDQALRERAHLEIRFPRVAGYRVELSDDRLTAEFTDDSVYVLTPQEVGPSITRNAAIIGEAVDLSLEHLGELRPSTLLFHLTQRLLYNH